LAITKGGAVDSGVARGEVLVALVDAALDEDTSALEEARVAARRDLGDAAFVDACAAIASFNAVVKVADGTGIPIEDWKEERTRDIRAALAIHADRQ
jgi:hypothetical protein